MKVSCGMCRNLKRAIPIVGLLALLLAVAPAALAQEPIQIIFLHHSSGHNLIEEGGVRQGLSALGYEFYDHGYNGDGLRLADGTYTGTNFDVPGDNTDPDGFAEIFSQPLHDPPDNTFSHLMQYDVIMFKSCFPVSNIWGEEHLEEYQSYYLTIRDRVDQYPDKLFVIVTQPPQVPGSSDPEEAERARRWVNWLQSDEYLGGRSNLVVFDFFDLLAGEDNFLRPEYRYDDYDAHPNTLANSIIGPIFVEFIDQAIRDFEPGAAPPPPAAGEGGGAAPSMSIGVIDDFEALPADVLTSDTDRAESTVECLVTSDMAHEGAASLHITHSVAPNGWVDCGRYYDAPQDWSGGEGVSFWFRTEESSDWITLTLYSGDGDDARPFEVSFEITPESAEDWVQVILPWSEFTKATWADAGGQEELDPALVTFYYFSLGAPEVPNKGVVWIDDVGLVGVEAPPPEPEGAEEEEPPAAEEEEPAAEEEEAPTPELKKETGGICPLGVIVPLGALGALVVSRRRRN